MKKKIVGDMELTFLTYKEFDELVKAGALQSIVKGMPDETLDLRSPCGKVVRMDIYRRKPSSEGEIENEKEN